MRLVKIATVFFTYLVLYPVTSYRKASFGERLRMACEKLGLTFIKIGQILSMRYDILSAEDCLALQKLLDKSNPLSFDVIEERVKEEYGKPYTKVFKSFSRDPIGSASISQVHKATLFNGRVVAVKIKRPFVERHLRPDMRALKSIAFVAMLFSKRLRDLRLLDTITSFEGWLRQDIDFRLEAANIRRLKEQEYSGKCADSEKIVCVDIVEELCTDNIIVMDFIDGIPMSNRQALRSHAQYDVEESIKTFVNAAIRIWFRDDLTEYLFQADPHLSNIIALPDGSVANIDCGLIATLSKKEARMCKKLLLAFYLKDTQRVVRLATEMGRVEYTVYKPILEDDIENFLDRIDDEGIGFWFFEFAKILMKHHIKYPHYLIVVGRANMVLDGLVEAYIPGHTSLDLIGNQLHTFVSKRLRKQFEGVELLRAGHAFIENLKHVSNRLDSDSSKKTSAFSSLFHWSPEKV